MLDKENVRVEMHELVAPVTPCRPPVNTLDRKTRRELIEVFEEIYQRNNPWQATRRESLNDFGQLAALIDAEAMGSLDPAGSPKLAQNTALIRAAHPSPTADSVLLFGAILGTSLAERAAAWRRPKQPSCGLPNTDGPDADAITGQTIQV